MFDIRSYKNNVLSFHGPFNLNLISFLANYIREMVIVDNSVGKKLFKIFIELVQNVSFYSAEVRQIPDKIEGTTGVGWCSIDESEDCFTISTGNLIKKEHGPVLLKNCNEINKLDEKELRNLKRKTRGQASIKDIGAHIGLIHTGLISGNPLDVEVSEVDAHYSYFRIRVKIEKMKITNN